MKQFRVYLKSELGKLKNQGDALWFLRSIPVQVLENCGLPRNHQPLASAFSSQDDVNAFVDSLTDDQLRILTKSCDQDWRRNGVFDKLSRHSIWVEASVPVDIVDIQQAEPQLAHIFRRHEFKLIAIVEDAELWTQEPYKNWDLHSAVHFRVCLGRFESRRCKLFDGIHRAILLARQSVRAIEMYYYTA
jgi:hypothetical protein